jgi:hypothetical protein
MSWAGWLLGGKPRLRHHGHLAGTGEYATHVAGVDDHWAAFEQVIGRRTQQSAHRECTAFLIPDPNQPFNPDAVAASLRVNRTIQSLSGDRAPAPSAKGRR